MTDVSKYRLNHTMYRVRDGAASVEFYTKVLGMKLLDSYINNDAKFSLYFLGYDDDHNKDIPRLSKQGILELTHNHGTETDPEFKGYNTGNGDIGGYGHIAVTVDNLSEAVKRFDTLNVNFMKRPEEGRMKHIAFIYDPDGYRIEILQHPGV
ncbi:Lactoylglutathione lyase [Smittium culicis]|uniref:Lactoylglutathione lyase n=1 Tax=Smittium culicis TaxID=133412 RepID=A0A1R1XBQ9_9FUNG|nr:Lactoylglutathione lyase [Smittium culicis]